ncbi:hypothetical protein J3E72DRAFT_371450 [Bipolaris maydis]|nr:hypothetical protein J3E72DRAFT_371450 [Bipolaris maydis]
MKPEVINTTEKIGELYAIVVRNDREKATHLRPGVGQLTETLTQSHPLLEDSVLKAHTLIIVTKGTLAHRHGKTDGGLSGVVASSSARAMEDTPAFLPECLAGHVGVVVIDEGHTKGGRHVNAWKAARWLQPNFCVTLTATPVPWSLEKASGIISMLQDEAVDRDAQRLYASKTLQNPYAEQVTDPTTLQYGAILAAFEGFFNRYDTVLNLGRVLKLSLGPYTLRSTYQSSCHIYPCGDVHRLGNLMPPSYLMRIHIENGLLSRKVWDNEYVAYLYKLLVNIHIEAAKFRGYKNILLTLLRPDEEAAVAEGEDKQKEVCPLPDKDNASSIVACFTGRSERLKLLLALIADWVAGAHEKVTVWCSNF